MLSLRHLECLKRIVELEIEIYGRLMSESILDDLRRDWSDAKTVPARMGYANLQWELQKLPQPDPSIVVRRYG